MNITVKGIHLDVGESLTSHVQTVLGGLTDKYFNSSAVDATVVFTKEKNHHYSVQVNMRVARGDVLESSSQAEEIYPAFDAAAEKLATRLRRYKDKLRDHHRKEDAAEMHMAAYTTFNAEKTEAEGPAV